MYYFTVAAHSTTALQQYTLPLHCGSTLYYYTLTVQQCTLLLHCNNACYYCTMSLTLGTKLTELYKCILANFLLLACVGGMAENNRWKTHIWTSQLTLHSSSSLYYCTVATHAITALWHLLQVLNLQNYINALQLVSFCWLVWQVWLRKTDGQTHIWTSQLTLHSSSSLYYCTVAVHLTTALWQFTLVLNLQNDKSHLFICQRNDSQLASHLGVAALQ